MRLITFFVLAAALAFAQPRPLDNIASRQYQHEIRPLRLALDRWLHELGFQDAGLSDDPRNYGTMQTPADSIFPKVTRPSEKLTGRSAGIVPMKQLDQSTALGPDLGCPRGLEEQGMIPCYDGRGEGLRLRDGNDLVKLRMGHPPIAPERY